jgi:hypothetical protein
VNATLKVRVESSTPVTPAAVAGEAAAAGEAPKTESRGHKRSQQQDVAAEAPAEKAPKAEKKAKAPKADK